MTALPVCRGCESSVIVRPENQDAQLSDLCDKLSVSIPKELVAKEEEEASGTVTETFEQCDLKIFKTTSTCTIPNTTTTADFTETNVVPNQAYDISTFNLGLACGRISVVLSLECGDEVRDYKTLNIFVDCQQDFKLRMSKS